MPASRQQALSFHWPSAPSGEIGYLLYVPADYPGPPDRLWPLILFLHGAGERGSSIDQIKRHGLPKMLEEPSERSPAWHPWPDFPALVVSPQCPDHTYWSVPLLGALLDAVAGAHAVDPDRVYVTGMSLGGYATWAFAIARPERFAAIAPVCGGGDPTRACRLERVPVWAFHGAQDEIVPLQATVEMVEALRACGVNPLLTVYPDAGHDSWTATYANPEFYTWLLAQRRHPLAGA